MFIHQFFTLSPRIRQLLQLVPVQPELLQRRQGLGDRWWDLGQAIPGQAQVAQVAQGTLLGRADNVEEDRRIMENSRIKTSSIYSRWTNHSIVWLKFFSWFFAHWVKAHNNICLAYTNIAAIHRLFWGPIALHCLVHFLNTTGPSVTKVLYAYFDRISYLDLFLISIWRIVIFMD